MVAHLPGNVDAVSDAKDNEADTGDMLHAQKGFFAEFLVAERHGPTEAQKPEAGASRDAADAGDFVETLLTNPFAGNEVCRQNYPEAKDARIAHDANEASHKGGVGMQSSFNPLLNFVCSRDRRCHEKFDA